MNKTKRNPTFRSIKNLQYLAVSTIAFVGFSPALMAMDQFEVIDKTTVISQNFRPRGDQKPQVLILHCVGLSDAWVTKNYGLSQENGGLGVSAHYYASQESKKIYQLVPEKDCAFHAGVSEWRGLAQSAGLKGLNDISIGIEFQSPGYGQVEGKGYYPYAFASFNNEQMGDAIVVCKNIMQRHDISAENVVWHSDVSPLRKTDPGPMFDGKRLAQHGIGVWPSSDRLDDSQLDTSLKGIQKGLKEWGYPDIEETGAFDKATKGVLTAHYMHYLPKEVCWENFKHHKEGSIFETITDWKYFPYDKEVLSISVKNLNKKNFEKNYF